MRILQVNNYAYLKGGSEKVFFETIDVLKKKGHEVYAFSMSDEKNRTDINLTSVEIKPYEERKGVFQTLMAIKNFFYNNDVEKRFSKLLDEVKPQIIHIHIVYGRLTNAIIKVASKYKIPIIQSVHEFRLLCPTYTCLNPNNEICERCASSLINLSCFSQRCNRNSLANSLLIAAECKYRDWLHNYQKNISGFIMVSKFIMDKHLRYFPIIKDKCFHIYNSVETSFYRQYVNVNKYQENRYYLYFGRLSYEKGIITLLDYFAKHPDLKLRIAGTGPLMENIKDKIQYLNNIELLGYKSGEELYRLIANAYFTIVPSEWYENNPLTVIESLALGTPIIGNNIGGIPEIIIKGDTGYIYDYRHAGEFAYIIETAENLTKDEYVRMCSCCLTEAVDNFDNEIYYKKLMVVYESILSNLKS